MVLERYLPNVNCKQTILTIRRQAIPHKKTISLKHIFLCVFLLIVFSPQSSFAKDKSSKTGPVAGPDGATVSITLSAEPTSLPGDGSGTSKIAATLLDSAGNPVPVGTSVSFSTDLGSFPGGKNFSVSTDDDTGLVIVSLIAGTIDGICTVTVESNSATQSITVPFFSEDTHGATAKIKLSAKPKSIPGDGSGSSIITATLLDSAGNPVPVGTSVSFSTSLGNFPGGKIFSVSTDDDGSFPGGKNFSISTDDDTGKVTVSLVAGSTPGKATVAANAGSFTKEIIVKFEAPETPWEITAKSLAYQEKEEIYTGEGDVAIRKDDQALYAQKVIYNVKTGIVKASGDVRLEAKGDILTGDQGTFNLDKQTGEMVNGRLFLSQNHYYISGSVMQKLGKNSYLIKQCHLTTCDDDGKAKPWSITGSEVKVTIEGYGKVKHAALRVREFPVLYVPYLIFPAKTKRQTGLLVPEIGYSSRKGFIYTQPFFWAINESSDATLYLEYMSRRGVKGGLEYRYMLKEKSKGTLMYDFLNDRHVDDGTDNSGEDWGYEEDSYNRPNSDRYWFRMKNDQELPFGFDMKADIDIVSDQDYLREFRYGYSGYYQTNRYFEKIFGRGLDGYDDTTRENNLNLNKSWSQFTLYGETRWYDDVISRRQGETYSPLFYLPRITFTGSRQKVFNTPLYFGLDSEYLYTYRRLATKTQRANVYPTIYLPLNLSYFSFETSFGVQETIWNIHEYESSSRDGTYNREIFYFKQDLQTDIYNVFDIKGKRLDRIKHVINPQIVYDFSPEETRKDTYPEGRAGETNLLTYSITNIFTSRSIKPSEKNDELKADEEDKLLNYTYNEFCRFKVQQSYDIKKVNEDKDNKEPFSPIYGEIKISPLKYLSVQADAAWDYYDNVWNSHNVNLSIWDNRGDRLSVEHRYTLDSRESIYYNILIKISEKISTYANYERNLYDNRDIEKGIGVIYSAQCWGINAFYLDDTDEETFGVEFKLYGLGGIGRQFIRGKTEGEY